MSKLRPPRPLLKADCSWAWNQTPCSLQKLQQKNPVSFTYGYLVLCCLLTIRYLSPPPDPSPGDTITDCPLYHVIPIFIIHTQPEHLPFPNLHLSIFDQIDERIDTFPNLITTLSVIHLTSKLSVIHTKPDSSPN